MHHNSNGLLIVADGNLSYKRVSEAFELAYNEIKRGKTFAKAKASQAQTVYDCAGPSWGHTSSEEVYEAQVTVRVIAPEAFREFLESGTHWSHLLPAGFNYTGNGYQGGVDKELL